ncbi:MAG TPA: AAA family ATPase [Solirubrobacterales bacterium]|nr:AAA family ATPase [Solirubrobacterales bacterium]
MGGVAIVVFSDLVDSTALLARLGDDRMDTVRRAHVKDVTDAVALGGGRVIKTLGDGVMSTFESALGAMRAAAAIQAAVERLDATHGAIGIAARVGVAAGEPIPDGEDLHGMAVVIASRLSSAAGTGEVLVQALVAELVASRDGVALEAARDYELKGVPGAVRAAKLRWRELVAGGGEAETAEAPEGIVVAAESNDDPPPMPRFLAAYAEEPLIGRDREIRALREAAAPRPGRRAVLVLGEPGIGKSRHAAAAAAEARARGAVVALARCPPEPVIAFEPWVRAIGELALAGDESWRARLAAAAGAELAALVPQLGDHARAPERAGAGEMVAAEGARYRLLGGISAALACAAGRSPLHLVLDDAHWCDPASAQALGHLLGSAPERMVLVVTARDREMGRGHPVSRALADLRRTGDLSELRLEGLDPSGLVSLVGARLGRAITPRLAARLQARTGGNPFFAGELARDLEDQGALRETESLEEAPAPDAVGDLVEERLGRLGPETEKLLGAAAAIGPLAQVALAARVAGLEPGEAESAVAEALAERLVDEVPAVRPTIAFPHALIREALLAGTGDAAQARLHLAIARALEEEPGAEPAELARHYGLAVAVAGAEPAIAAHRAAASAAAAAHDHERAADQMRRALALLPEGDRRARSAALLELGEQELLAADMVRARESFRAASERARGLGDSAMLARAALGFAGGDVGFGWEVDMGDSATTDLLREGLEALGPEEPRLALRIISRLAYLLVFTEDEDVMPALVKRAEELDRRLGDAESELLAGFTRMTAMTARSADPMSAYGRLEEFTELVEIAEGCGREELLFRVVMWVAVLHYAMRRIPECEAAIDRAGEIAARLGPRFSWEVDVTRGSRLIDRGDRAGGEALIRRGGAILRRLRPDLHISVELAFLAMTGLFFDAETKTSRAVLEAMEAVVAQGFVRAVATLAAAIDGDSEAAERRLRSYLSTDLAAIRQPDAHLPASLCALAWAASIVGDQAAGERLRPLLEPLRPYLIQAPPSLFFGSLPEWHIGRLELLAGRPEAAVEGLREAVEQADELELALVRAWARVDLAGALHRCGAVEEARAALAEGEEIAARFGLGLVARFAGEVGAELDGREAPRPGPAGAPRSRPIRAIATRGTRRALAASVAGLEDAELERRFAERRRQRALMKGVARGFQPAGAGGFSGTIAYELEPYAIEPPPDAPWRWAIEVDSRAGRARLAEPAPLDAAVTIHFGLADWVRVLAGTQDPLTAMVAGRCSVEGDVTLAARLETMFGAR